MNEPTDDWTDPSGRPVVAAPTDQPPVPGGQPAWGQPAGGQPGWGQPAPVAPKPGVIPLRPLGLGELLDGAVTIIRGYPKPTLGLSAVIALVSTVLSTLFVLALESAMTSVSTEAENLDVGAVVTSFSLGAPAFLVSFLAGLVLTGVLTAVVGRAVLGREMTLAQAWEQIRPQLWQLLGLSLLTALIIVVTVLVPVLLAVGIGLFTGPVGLVIGIPLGLAGLAGGVYLYVRLALAPAALILERCSVTQSLRRSGVLVRGSWWRVAGILLLTAIIGAFIAGILQIPFGLFSAVSSNSDSTFALVATQIGSGLAACLVAPFTTGVHALLYVDRRMRAEGLDVALRSASTVPPA